MCLSFSTELNSLINPLSAETIEAQVQEIILKLYGQHLLTYSEMNFHSRLNLQDHLIAEIYDLAAEKYYSLKNVNLEEYNRIIQEIAALDDFKSVEITSLPAENKELYTIFKRSLLRVWGNDVYGRQICLKSCSYINTRAEDFLNSDYVNYFEKSHKR